MIAAENGRHECVRLLLSEIKMADDDGWTALMHAAMWGRHKCVKLLMGEIKMTNYRG